MLSISASKCIWQLGQEDAQTPGWLGRDHPSHYISPLMPSASRSKSFIAFTTGFLLLFSKYLHVWIDPHWSALSCSSTPVSAVLACYLLSCTDDVVRHGYWHYFVTMCVCVWVCMLAWSNKNPWLQWVETWHNRSPRQSVEPIGFVRGTGSWACVFWDCLWTQDEEPL